jgi:pilus assembly protein FimV
MVRKKLAMAILALSALQANFANALGLGNLSIKSTLNQPLNAEIKLLDAGDLDPTQVKIQLAAAEDFQRSGVDRDYFLTNLRFSVVMDGHGGGTIHISTKEPVVEPYLNFVLEARWPSGRLLREFAVLLDPPTFSASKGAGMVAPASTAAAQPAKKAAIQPPTVTSETTTTKSVPEASMSLPATGKSGEYRVQVYDTLSKIAARYKPASDVSVAQTMLAIQRANPDAFINNNINLIKSGAIVRLPTAEDIHAIPAAQANQETEEQTHAWRSGAAHSGGGATAAAAGPQLDASAPAPSKREGGYQEKARLSIAAPGGSDKASAGEGAGASGKGTEALRTQLATSQESLDKGKRDNRELQSKLDDMERQIATLQRLITLKDDQLAALQTTKPATDKSDAAKPVEQASVAQPIATEPAASAEPASAAAESAAPAAETITPSTETAATQPVAQPAPVAPAAAKPAPAPKPAQAPSLLDQLTSNPAYLGGGAIALLLAVAGGLFLKRRNQDEAYEESEDDFTLDDDNTFPFSAAESDTALFNDSALTSANDVGAVESAAPFAVPEEQKKTVRSETGDAIAETDIYIAYGRYQQAVDLLSNAIDAEPARSDLRVKLLEVYVEMRNRDAFRQQFAELQGLGDGNAVAQVKDMLSSVDGVSDWLDGVSGGGASSFAATAGAVAATAAITAFAADELKDDLSDEVDVIADSDVDAESELDLDLDFDFDDTPASTPTPTFDNSFGLPAEAVASDDMAFDLELDADTAATSAQELSDLTLDFDTSAPASSPAPTFDFNSSGESTDEGLELDLGDDDLDRMLGELGGGDELADLEGLSTSTVPTAPAWQPRSAQPEPAPSLDEEPALDLNEELTFDSSEEFTLDLSEEPVLDLSEEFDLSQAAEDLSSPAADEIDVFAGLDAQPNVSAASDFDDSFVAVPEPVAEPVVTAASPVTDGGDDFDFLSDSDEVATKLDLARAYIDMGDTDGARDILDEVLQDGTDNQKEEASSLLSRIG